MYSFQTTYMYKNVASCYDIIAGLGNRGTRVFISGEHGSKNEGQRGTKAFLRNRQHRKSRFGFWGTGE